MIDERELRRLIEEAAGNYDLPENGRQSILDAAGQGDASPGRGWRSPRFLPAAAAVVALFAVGSVLIGSFGGSSVDRASREARVGDEASGGGGGAAASQAQTQTQLQVTPAAGASTGPSAGPAPAPVPRSATGASAPESGARVVKTGELQMEVDRGRFATAMDRLTALTVSRGGYIAQTQTTEGDTAPSGTVTLRVPAGEFDAVVAEVRQLGKVISATTRGQDVTAQYADVEARLRALNASRDQVLTVLSKASTVGDILAVQERLNSIQVQIEQLQGQQKVLDDQTTFGTVAVRIAEPGADGVGQPRERSGLSGAWDDARGGFGDGLEAIVAGSGTALIIVMALAVVALAGRGAWLLTRRRLV